MRKKNLQHHAKEIFKLAEKEGLDIHRFGGEKAIFCKGFKVSINREGIYNWEDVRISDYFDKVDPSITQEILETGFFVDTLAEVRLHNDTEKLLIITREVEKLDKQTDYWVVRSNDNYLKYEKRINKIKTSYFPTKKEQPSKEDKIKGVERRYRASKTLFQKKRRILKEEKEDLMADYAFFQSRLKLYKKKPTQNKEFSYGEQRNN